MLVACDNSHVCLLKIWQKYLDKANSVLGVTYSDFHLATG